MPIPALAAGLACALQQRALQNHRPVQHFAEPAVAPVQQVSTHRCRSPRHANRVVLRTRLAERDDDFADRAGREPQRHEIEIGLRVFGKRPVAGGGEHLDDLLAREPAQQIDEVTSRIDERRGVFLFTPAIVGERAFGQIVNVIALEIRQGAKRPLGDQRLDAPVQRHEAHLVHDRNHLAGRSGRGTANRPQAFDRIGQRLLDQHVQTALERRNDVCGVRAVWRAHDDGIEVGPEAVLVVEEDVAGAAPRGPAPRRWFRIENLRDATTGDARKVEMMRLSRAAESDDPDAQHQARCSVKRRIRESIPTDDGWGTPRARAARSTAYSASGPRRVMAYRRYLLAGPPEGSQ